MENTSDGSDENGGARNKRVGDAVDAFEDNKRKTLEDGETESQRVLHAPCPFIGRMFKEEE